MLIRCLLIIGVLCVVAFLWSRLFQGERETFHCVGCGKCVAAGECVYMKEERARKLALAKKREMKKKAGKEGENPRSSA